MGQDTEKSCSLFPEKTKEPRAGQKVQKFYHALIGVGILLQVQEWQT